MKPRTLKQKRYARKAYFTNKKIKANNPNKGEWIAMRLLFLFLATDPSSVHIEDIKRTIEYFKNRFVDKDVFDKCLRKISYEHSLNSTFVDNPDCKLIRDLGKSITLDGEKDDGTHYFGTTSYILKLSL